MKTVFDQLHHASGFEGGALPGRATLYLCPHKFYGVQIRMIGRESQPVMPMLPQDNFLRHTLAGAFEFFRSEEAQNMKKKNTPLNRFDPGTPVSNAVDITTALQNHLA